MAKVLVGDWGGRVGGQWEGVLRDDVQAVAASAGIADVGIVYRRGCVGVLHDLVFAMAIATLPLTSSADGGNGSGGKGGKGVYCVP